MAADMLKSGHLPTADETVNTVKNMSRSTERKLLDELRALRLSEQRFRDFTRSTSDWFWELDENLRFVGMTDGLRQAYGMDDTGIVGKTPWEVADADAERHPAWRRHREDLLAHRPFRDFRVTRELADGRVRHLRISGVPIFGENGHFYGYRGTTTDETEVVEARERAEHAEERLQSAISALADGFAVFDPDDRLVVFNEPYRRMLDDDSDVIAKGATFEEILRALCGPGGLLKVDGDLEGFVARRMESHRRGQVEVEFELKDGNWVRVRERRAPDGSTVLIISDFTQLKKAALDLEMVSRELEGRVDKRTLELAERNARLAEEIRGRAEAENQLREAERDYRELFENAGIGIYRTSLDGKWLRANPALVALNGYRTEEEFISAVSDIGKEWFVDPDRRRQLLEMLNEQGSVTDFTSEVYRHRTGERIWISETARLVRDSRGAPLYYEGTVQDVTAQKRIEVALRQAKDEAVMASKSKSDFLAHMSHELRTPLNAILGFTEVMQLKIFGPVGSKQYEDYLDNIQTSGKHLLSLINDLLDLSKIEAGRWDMYEDTVNVAELIETIVRLTRPTADKRKLHVVTNVPNDLPDLYCDSRAIKQVVLNLLSNATKFTPEQGRISITASLRPDDSLRITVADTGIGIAEEDLPRVLEPFVQTRTSSMTSTTGTGLGLPLAKSLMEQHGGKLTLASMAGLGTTAIVEFPSYRTRKTDRGGDQVFEVAV